MDCVYAEIAPDLPRKKTAQMCCARGSACGAAKLDFLVGEDVENAAGIRPAQTAAFYN